MQMSDQVAKEQPYLHRAAQPPGDVCGWGWNNGETFCDGYLLWLAFGYFSFRIQL